MRRLVVFTVFLFPGAAAAAPGPAIVASATRGPAPLTVRFTADAPALVSYAWIFGDGQSATGAAVAHRFAKPGRYVVTLAVTDVLGGVTTATTEVRAQSLSLRLAPAALVFGKRAVARGVLVPAEAGSRVVLERRSSSGWQTVSTAKTDSAGRYNARLLTAAERTSRSRRAARS